jgi:hypothetical protein
MKGSESPFPKWGNLDSRDSSVTYLNQDTIPEESRTPGYSHDFEDGGFETVEPIATLHRCYLGIFAEIIRISYWIARKEDGTTFYQVNLVQPYRIAFDPVQPGAIGISCHFGRQIDDFESVRRLLADAKTFIEWHQKQKE